MNAGRRQPAARLAMTPANTPRRREITAMISGGLAILFSVLLCERLLDPPDRAAGAVRPPAADVGGKRPLSAGAGAATARDSASVPSDPRMPRPAAAGRRPDRLQELLDNGQDGPALVEARVLAADRDPAVRREALDGLRWIGPAATADVAALAADPDPGVAERASGFLEELLETEPDPARQAHVLGEAIAAVGAEARAPLLLRLTGLPPSLAAPPLVDLLASSDPELQAAAREHLVFISDGEQFGSVAEWEAWALRLPAEPPMPVDEQGGSRGRRKRGLGRNRP